MVKPIDWIIKDWERRRRVPIPLGVTQFKNREMLDRVIESKNIEGINLFFNNPANFDFSSLNILSEELQKSRNVSREDSDFIDKLVIEIKSAGGFNEPLTNSVGSFLQVEETLTEMPLTQLPKRMRIAILFWSYLTIIESATSDLSELFYRISLNKKDKKYINVYEEYLKKGEHPLFSHLRKAALRWNLIKPQETTFLNSNNLRNYISHANLYYDSIRDKILLPNQEELTFIKFEEEYLRVYDFFKEFIFKLNDKNADLASTAEKLRKSLAKSYLKLVRSGATKKLWKSQKKLPWEENKSP
jgi:hypothetical protein